MTIADESRMLPVAFGAGGTEPYAEALRSGRPRKLFLQELDSDDVVTTTAAQMDLAKWNAAADQTDLRLLSRVDGPVLDVGCGPGRMVRAARDLGLDAWGIDISAAAVDVVRRQGLPVLHGSVFDRLPDEGFWQTVLLVDGNVGIGGDVEALLRRCRQLLAPTGEIVVELHPDDLRDRSFRGRLVDPSGGRSASFPWAEIGVEPMAELAPEVGLELAQTWSEDGRSFCRLLNIRR